VLQKHGGGSSSSCFRRREGISFIVKAEQELSHSSTGCFLKVSFIFIFLFYLLSLNYSYCYSMYYAAWCLDTLDWMCVSGVWHMLVWYQCMTLTHVIIFCVRLESMIIILNYFHFQNYYRCLCVCVNIVSGVCVCTIFWDFTCTTSRIGLHCCSVILNFSKDKYFPRAYWTCLYPWSLM